MIQILFWLSVLGALYSYLIYPITLRLLPKWRSRSDELRPQVNRVAIIIAARNEEEKIADKLNNTLSLDHTGCSLDIIVASDASDDATDSIVRIYESRGIRLVRSPARKGKEHAQGLAIAASDAEVIVFTDTGTILPNDALINLLEIFKNPEIGAVSSVDRFVSPDGSIQGEGAYVRYEMWLRDLETQFYSLVGLSGSFFAARRRVCQNWDSRVQSDFGTALSCVQNGLRAVSARTVIGYYRNITESGKEYQRKVRTVTRGMNSLRLRADVLNFAQYGRFSFEVFSHKLMRWATPWFLAVAFCLTFVLAPHYPLFLIFLMCQVTLYALPFLARIAPGIRRIALARIGIYFVEVNVAMIHAAFLVVAGRSILTWEPSKR